MIDEGTYTGDLAKAVLSKIGNKGSECMQLTFDIKGENVQRTVNVWMTDAALEKSLEKLDGLGWNDDTSEPEFDRAQNVSLSCKHEQYEKDEEVKDKEVWELANWGSFAGEPLATDEHKKLEAKIRARRKGRSKKPSTSPSSSKGAPERPKTSGGAPPRPGKTDDDPLSKVVDQDSAYDYYEADCKKSEETPTPTAFWNNVSRVEKEHEIESPDFEPKHWQQAAPAIPF